MTIIVIKNKSCVNYYIYSKSNNNSYKYILYNQNPGCGHPVGLKHQ